VDGFMTSVLDEFPRGIASKGWLAKQYFRVLDIEEK
jgi:hypothetical protein